MCGRFGLYDLSGNDRIKENMGYRFKRNFNVAPSQTVMVCTALDVTDMDQMWEPMKWGIHRQIGKDKAKDIINTRSDKAFGRFWGKTVRTKRCLVPANGFYEWKTVGKQKIPHWIHLKQQKLFHFAGIYAVDADFNYSFSIMTTTPNKEMSEIHDRMPVILTQDREHAWLAERDDEILSELLAPLPNHTLELYRVSNDVNTPRNNSKHLLERIE